MPVSIRDALRKPFDAPRLAQAIEQALAAPAPQATFRR